MSAAGVSRLAASAPRARGAAPNDAEARLDGFVAKFAPEHQRLIRAVRKALQRRLAGAWELVYDNYNFFVIGYSATERPSDALLSIAASSNGVSLCFLHGAKLADPHHLLSGSGKQTRFLRVESAAELTKPAVEALIAAAVTHSKKPFPPDSEGRLVIRSVSAKQRPRRRD
jgi:Domain of unknown function (DU1801)